MGTKHVMASALSLWALGLVLGCSQNKAVDRRTERSANSTQDSRQIDGNESTVASSSKELRENGIEDRDVPAAEEADLPSEEEASKEEPASGPSAEEFERLQLINKAFAICSDSGTFSTRSAFSFPASGAYRYNYDYYNQGGCQGEPDPEVAYVENGSSKITATTRPNVFVWEMKMEGTETSYEFFITIGGDSSFRRTPKNFEEAELADFIGGADIYPLEGGTP